jgi:hypothetical protein
MRFWRWSEDRPGALWEDVSSGVGGVFRAKSVQTPSERRLCARCSQPAAAVHLEPVHQPSAFLESAATAYHPL